MTTFAFVIKPLATRFRCLADISASLRACLCERILAADFIKSLSIPNVNFPADSYDRNLLASTWLYAVTPIQIC